MIWKPDRTNNRPLYKQIADYIEQGITSGEYTADYLLPSERALAKQMGVNRSTVVAAYGELQSLGIIERKKGSGTRISTDVWGLSKKRVPNWGRYVEDGALLPNLPLVQRIRSELQNSELINFASGELSPSLLPREHLQKIISSQPFSWPLGHGHPQGNENLRTTVSEHVLHYKNISADSSSILITSGAQQGLHLILQCLLKTGDAIAIEDPSYCYSLPLFKSAGLRTFLLPVDEGGVNPDDLITLHKNHRIRMIFLNPDHHNPSGTSMHISRRQKIMELSAELGIPIIEDDPYSLTSYNKKIKPTLKSMDVNGNVLYLSSLSKIAASGLRIGWVIGPKQVIERLADAKQQVDFGHSVFPQWVANEFLKSEQFNLHIRKLQHELSVRCNELTSCLDQYLGGQVSYFKPAGGIHLWCKINRSIDEYQLLETAIKQGVVYTPGSIFGSQSGYARFTFGRVEPEAIADGVARFAKAIRKVQ